jgi:hypothetical protein
VVEAAAMNKWTVPVVALFALLMLTFNATRATAELKPLMAGWEQYFTVTWEPAQVKGRQVLQGYVNNTSSYDLRNIRILVETLDTAGATTSQRVAWVPGEMNGASRLFFEVPVDSAPTYRVRIFSYDRMEFPSIMR